jgi:hypothetical protein
MIVRTCAEEWKMRRGLFLLLAVFAWISLAGMAKAPGPDVPSPDIDFRATVRDDQEISTKVAKATWDGNTYFTGSRGKGAVTISFEKVKKAASMGSAGPNKTDFQITLRTGDVFAVTFDNDARFMGATSFGTYRILAKNIKEIVFE